MRKNNTKVSIIGCGDIGRRVASLYQKDGVQTSAITRSVESLAQARAANIDALQLDLNDVIESGALPDGFLSGRIFYFAPPPPQGLQDTRLARFLAIWGGQIKRIVLISTTGVYGDCAGGWVDETAATKPKAERAKRRLHAEMTLKQWAQEHHGQYVILRVPGIYALDRLPLARLRKAMPIVQEAQAPWTNRIHADDLAKVCRVAMEAVDITADIFNVTDSNPSTMTHYFNRVADYANLPRPRQISLQQAGKELSAGMMSYMNESRRVSNQKMLRVLNIHLQYPSLDSCLKK